MRGPAARITMTVLLLASLASAQSPPAPAPAPVDTAVVRLSWPGPAPRSVSVWPDEVLFGQEIVIVLDLAEELDTAVVDSLAVDAPWLEPVPASAAIDLPLPPATGPRQLARYRIYREGPWRVAWGDGAAGPVQMVSGRVDDPAQIEPVRDPRAIGGVPRWLLVTFAVGLLLACLGSAWWLWRRRQERIEPVYPRLPAPAWIAAAVALRRLEQERGLDRDSLDALAGILRRYVRGRFHLPAEEMTAPELRSAADRAGWAREVLTGFADLIAACDDARYAPDRIGSPVVHRGVGRALDLIEAVRIDPEYTPVSAGELVEARAAWSWLRERHPLESAGEVSRC